ncbi:MAG: hypothetical protein ABI488_19105 [Polyangiaceae bacterium]
MAKSSVLIPVLAGAAALGAVAYAFSRPSRRSPATISRSRFAEPDPRHSVRVARDVPGTEYLDLDGIFDANPEDALEHATVHADTRAPLLASADDAEPPSPEDLGAYWLSRATDSERSRDESDLELEIEAVADPTDSMDADARGDDDDEGDDDDDGDRLAINDTRA